VASPGAGRAVVDDSSVFEHVSASARIVPARVTGVVGDSGVCGHELAVAVNGSIVALTRCSREGDVLRFRAMVPESAFREGSNRVDVFAVEGRNTEPYLVPLGSTRA
jgi:hypothetical protein